jgi:glycosyltransferase involved in cell wall biosynthesis
VSEPDDGIYDAMNKAIRMAAGDWIYFLGADDALCPGVLQRLEPHLRERSLDAVYGNVLFVRKGRTRIYGGAFDWRKLYRQNICHQAIFYRRSVFARLGVFDLRYRYLADWEFNYRLFGHNELAKRFVDEIVAEYNAGGASGRRSADPRFWKDRDQLFRKAFGANRLMAMWSDALVRLGKRLLSQ